MNATRGLRLLVLTELFLPTKGGTAVWFDEVYRRLGGRGIHILTAQVPGAAAYDARHPNCIHRLRLAPVPWLRPESLPRYLRPFLHGLGVMLRHRVEAVHAGRVLPEGLVGLWLARLLERPLLVYAHGEEITGWRAPRRRRAMRRVYRAADAVIANSAFTRGLLLELGVSPGRVHLLHPGVALERFTPEGPVSGMPGCERLHEGWPLVVSVGRLNPRKGFDRGIEAVARLRHAGLDVDYVIIGIGEDEARLRALVAAHGVSDRVHLLGHVPMEDLPAWLRRADVFLMPNRDIGGDTEGFGMVFIEAAACGTPAIAGRAGGTGDAVLDGETGLRVDGEDPDAVARALAALLRDPARRAALAARALERARREFSWDSVAARTRRIHASLVGGRRSRPASR
ncbi:MAG: glycosyltransferase family 4 protein [Gammaproteobacteria bacterium]|nr:MAG: glycosyltransferase family 4 protein [Gammaproteobacteria bacterium]